MLHLLIRSLLSWPLALTYHLFNVSHINQNCNFISILDSTIPNIHKKLECQKSVTKSIIPPSKKQWNRILSIIRSQKMYMSNTKKNPNGLTHFLCINRMRWMFYCLWAMCLESTLVALCFCRLSFTIRLCGIENKGIFHREKAALRKQRECHFFLDILY